MDMKFIVSVMIVTYLYDVLSLMFVISILTKEVKQFGTIKDIKSGLWLLAIVAFSPILAPIFLLMNLFDFVGAYWEKD